MRCKVTIDTSHYPKEVPWELPRGWVWCHLSDLASFAGGKTPSMDNKDFWKNGKHLWITSKDMKSRYLIDSQMKISDTAVREMTVFHPGTILMVNRSGILRRTLPLAILNAEATINQDIKAIVPYLLCISPYLYYAILSQESFILSEYKKAGTTVDNINFDKFISLLIPLPPQKEQDRIVSSINQYFAIIENIDSSQKELNTSLEAAKAKILDLAIRGKLVPQDPNEEPAIELLKRINLNFTPSDNLHYEDCPIGWQVVTLKEIVSLYSGRDLEAARCNAEHRGIPYLVGASCIDNQNISVYRWTENPEVVAKINDTLLSCKGTVGEVILNQLGDVHIARQFMSIRSKSPQLILPKYIELIIKASIEKLRSTARGIIPGISREDILEMTVAIPPLAEQKRILTRISELESSLSFISLSIRN